MSEVQARDRLTRPRKRIKLSPSAAAVPVAVAAEAPADDDADDADMTDEQYLAKRMRRKLGAGTPAQTEDVSLKPREPDKIVSSSPAYRACFDVGPPSDGVDADEAVIGRTGRLFLRNLPFSTTESDLRSTFAKHGVLQQASGRSTLPASRTICDSQDELSYR
jgi:hypothetical protein